MGINIQLKDTKVPVEIGAETFYFDMADENLKKITESYKLFIEDMANLDLAAEEGLALTKIKACIDIILGEGSGDKIYTMAPSTSVMVNVLSQLFEELTKEMKKIGFENENEQYKKYLKKVK